MGKLRARNFFFTQYEVNNRTGESLNFDESNIIAGVAHKSIKKWAYIKHDKDVYSAADEAADSTRIQGEPKLDHWHVVIACENAIEIDMVARWFGVPENMINVGRGSSAFLDCVQYLTHERPEQLALGKFRYPDSDVKTSPGFDFRSELKARPDGFYICDGHSPFKRKKDFYRWRVSVLGLTLEELKAEDPDAYLDYSEDGSLAKWRHEYLENNVPMPSLRFNIYITGPGGVGKDLLSRALARNLADPELKIHDSDYADDKLFFEVGNSGVTFEGYDGQSVIIWSDCRASTLIKKFGSYEGVLQFFDTSPHPIAQNKKFSHVVLKNKFNIVNSVQPFEEFVSELVKGEDVSQAKRRFPLFLPVSEETIAVFMNTGFFAGTREYDQYVNYTNIVNNLRPLVRERAENSLISRKVQSILLADVLKLVNKGCFVLSNSSGTATDEEILKKYTRSSYSPSHKYCVVGEGSDCYLVPYEEVLRTIKDNYLTEVPEVTDSEVIPCFIPTVDEHGEELPPSDFFGIFHNDDDDSNQVSMFDMGVIDKDVAAVAYDLSNFKIKDKE